MENKIILLDCPICGSSEIKFHKPNQYHKEDVVCLNCGLKMEKALDNSKGAIEWWNTRINK